MSYEGRLKFKWKFLKMRNKILKESYKMRGESLFEVGKERVDCFIILFIS